MEVQTISNKYIDKNDLGQLLVGLFGDNFTVEAQAEHFVLTIPRFLTQQEIQSIMRS